MSECRGCGCNCDPGDLRNGLCDDCRDLVEEKEDMPQMAYGGNSYGYDEKAWQQGRMAAGTI